MTSGVSSKMRDQLCEYLCIRRAHLDNLLQQHSVYLNEKGWVESFAWVMSIEQHYDHEKADVVRSECVRRRWRFWFLHD
jgi:hypothetical protein